MQITALNYCTETHQLKNQSLWDCAYDTNLHDHTAVFLTMLFCIMHYYQTQRILYLLLYSSTASMGRTKLRKRVAFHERFHLLEHVRHLLIAPLKWLRPTVRLQIPGTPHELCASLLMPRVLHTPQLKSSEHKPHNIHKPTTLNREFTLEF